MVVEEAQVIMTDLKLFLGHILVIPTNNNSTEMNIVIKYSEDSCEVTNISKFSSSQRTTSYLHYQKIQNNVDLDKVIVFWTMV